jgi:hypothetical protein
MDLSCFLLLAHYLPCKACIIVYNILHQSFRSGKNTLLIFNYEYVFVHRSEDLQLLRPSASGDAIQRPLSSQQQAGTSINPIPPPRTRKSSSHNSLLLAQTATVLPDSVPDIQAATAIAGQISANQELPYMTPPVPAPDVSPPEHQQVNFSGDSQDSSEFLVSY